MVCDRVGRFEGCRTVGALTVQLAATYCTEGRVVWSNPLTHTILRVVMICNGRFGRCDVASKSDLAESVVDAVNGVDQGISAMGYLGHTVTYKVIDVMKRHLWWPRKNMRQEALLYIDIDIDMEINGTTGNVR